MDTSKLKFTQLQAEILTLLCIKAGSALNQREIAKNLKVSPTAVAKSLPKLESNGIIKYVKNKTMNLNQVSLNIEKKGVIQEKRVENLRFIYRSDLINFLQDSLPGASIILFGSYSRGEDTIESDIDIAIIGRTHKNLNLGHFEKILERRITLNYYTSFKDIHKDLKENICNGIVLVGGIEF